MTSKATQQAAAPKQQEQEQEQQQPESPPPLPSPSPADAALAHHMQSLLAAHRRAHVFGRREGTGGMIPAVFDPSNGEVYFALVLSNAHNREWSSPHGGVDTGETLVQGASRECFEECRGAFGDLTTLWRACSLCWDTTGYKGKKIDAMDLLKSSGSNNNPHRPRPFSVTLGRGNVFLVNCGEMTHTERQAVVTKFHATKSWNLCSAEMAHVGWFRAKLLRKLLQCKEEDADAEGMQQVRRSGERVALGDRGDANKTQQRPQYVRNCLANLMCHPRFWKHPVLAKITAAARDSASGGAAEAAAAANDDDDEAVVKKMAAPHHNPLAEFVANLSELPALSEELKQQLPFAVCPRLKTFCL